MFSLTELKFVCMHLKVGNVKLLWTCHFCYLLFWFSHLLSVHSSAFSTVLKVSLFFNNIFKCILLVVVIGLLLKLNCHDYNSYYNIILFYLTFVMMITLRVFLSRSSTSNNSFESFIHFQHQLKHNSQLLST